MVIVYEMKSIGDKMEYIKSKTGSIIITAKYSLAQQGFIKGRFILANDN